MLITVSYVKYITLMAIIVGYIWQQFVDSENTGR